MDLHVQARNVTIRPEWSDVISSRVARLADQFPELIQADVILNHTRCEVPKPEDVRIVASVPGQTLRAIRRGAVMTVTLRSALDALERQLAAYRTARHLFTKLPALPAGDAALGRRSENL